jgi:hypothetical protein
MELVMQTTAFSLEAWKTGQQVSGNYCGVPYVGVIAEGRNTPDYRNWIFEVELAEPIEVYGQVRNHVSVWTNTNSATIEAVQA